MADLWRSTLCLPPFDWTSARQSAAQQGDDSPTWAYRWRSGERLADDLELHCTPKGLRVADLGCGQGFLGLRALLLGAHSVCFADASAPVLAWVKALTQANNLENRALCAQHTWGSALPPPDYHLILGGDILYRPECQADLLRTIARSLHPDGCALLVDPRHSLEPNLPAMAADLGLQWECRRVEDRYTLVRLSPCA